MEVRFQKEEDLKHLLHVPQLHTARTKKSELRAEANSGKRSSELHPRAVPRHFGRPNVEQGNRARQNPRWSGVSGCAGRRLLGPQTCQMPAMVPAVQLLLLLQGILRQACSAHRPRDGLARLMGTGGRGASHDQGRRRRRPQGRRGRLPP